VVVLITTFAISAIGTWLILESRKRRTRFERYSAFTSTLYGAPSPERMLEAVKDRYAHGHLNLEQAGELITLILEREDSR
jgi:hypothetical protein